MDYSDLTVSKFMENFVGSAVVDQLFYVLPIVCVSSVFVFVLLCITVCPF